MSYRLSGRKTSCDLEGSGVNCTYEIVVPGGGAGARVCGQSSRGHPLCISCHLLVVWVRDEFLLLEVSYCGDW